MKNKFLSIFLIFGIVLTSFPNPSFAQWGEVGSIAISPSKPTTKDTIKVMVSSSFSSGDCQLKHSEVFSAGDTVDVFGDYCLGLLTFICNSNDVFSVNPLPAGDYHIVFHLRIGTAMDTCPSIFTETDTSMLTITVDPLTNTKEEFQGKLSIYPNPANQDLFIDLSEQVDEVKIFDLIGHPVGKYSLQSGITSLDISHLSNGVYFVVFYEGERKWVYKFLVLR